MAIIKYSKSSSEIIKLKQDFFNSNQQLLENALNINNKYIQQPKRLACKNCLNPITDYDFVSFNVPYSICNQCGHLNGGHEDTEEFVNYLYSENSGENYAYNYLSDYDQRVNDIYLPKLDFLIDVLSSEFNKSDIKLLDIGCGCGHFIKACEIRGVNAIGYDPNYSLVTMGKTKLLNNQVFHCDMAELIELIFSSPASVISMIGVLEHLRKPLEAITAFKNSKAQYLYISVPLFSFSVFLEHISPKVYPLQLSGGHTHLYTKESLKYLTEKFCLNIVGEWWFGADIVNLFRTIAVQLDYAGNPKLKLSINNLFGNYLDQLQHILDRNKICDEVHIVFSKK